MIWIETSNGTPDSDRFVWICVDGKTMMEGRYKNGKWYGCFINTGLIPIGPASTVTHYMELPALPKKIET